LLEGARVLAVVGLDPSVACPDFGVVFGIAACAPFVDEHLDPVVVGGQVVSEEVFQLAFDGFGCTVAALGAFFYEGFFAR